MKWGRPQNLWVAGCCRCVTDGSSSVKGIRVRVAVKIASKCVSHGQTSSAVNNFLATSTSRQAAHSSAEPLACPRQTISFSCRKGSVMNAAQIRPISKSFVASLVENRLKGAEKSIPQPRIRVRQRKPVPSGTIDRSRGAFLARRSLGEGGSPRNADLNWIDRRVSDGSCGGGPPEGESKFPN